MDDHTQLFLDNDGKTWWRSSRGLGLVCRIQRWVFVSADHEISHTNFVFRHLRRLTTCCLGNTVRVTLCAHKIMSLRRLSKQLIASDDDRFYNTFLHHVHVNDTFFLENCQPAHTPRYGHHRALYRMSVASISLCHLIASRLDFAWIREQISIQCWPSKRNQATAIYRMTKSLEEWLGLVPKIDETCMAYCVLVR